MNKTPMIVIAVLLALVAVGTVSAWTWNNNPPTAYKNPCVIHNYTYTNSQGPYNYIVWGETWVRKWDNKTICYVPSRGHGGKKTTPGGTGGNTNPPVNNDTPPINNTPPVCVPVYTETCHNEITTVYENVTTCANPVCHQEQTTCKHYDEETVWVKNNCNGNHFGNECACTSHNHQNCHTETKRTCKCWNHETVCADPVCTTTQVGHDVTTQVCTTHNSCET